MVLAGALHRVERDCQAQEYSASPTITADGVVRQRGGRRGPPRGPSGEQSQPAPPAEEQESDDEKQEEGKDDDKEGKDDDESDDDAIKRPKTPPRVPDPRELDVRPDEQGRVMFSFHNQPWPDVVQWLANISGTSLDWQELPGDYLNLSTQRPLRVAETRDLVNRLLLDRGYTVIHAGNVMSVVKIAKLDPSLLHRAADESELADLPPYDFVKITFQLPTQLKADKAAEDVKPLLSEHGKVQALMATNRILVIDAVANLRSVSHLINAEHSAATSHIVPRTFHIKHARADHVADQVMVLLGLDPEQRRTPQELQLEQQKLQLFMQMQQRGKDVSRFLKKDGPRIFVTVDRRRNLILANAPRDEMQIIERAIAELDVPAGGYAAAAPDDQLRIERYKMVTMDPFVIINSLDETGQLHPRSKLNADPGSKTLIAYASSNDHQLIQSMIDSLDGTGRRFKVVWLSRRLKADAVAATIHELMVGKQEENNNFPWYYYRRRSRRDEQPNKGFRVAPDVERNRLLLWANDAEFREVDNLLRQLGEYPGESGNPNTVRLLESRGERALERMLRAIEQTWPDNSNPIQIERAKPPLKKSRPPTSTEKEDQQAVVVPAPRRWHRSSGSGTNYFAQFPSRQAQPGDVAGAGLADDGDTSDVPGKAPIRIYIDEEGRVILNSEDTRALDRLEELLTQVAPAPRSYKVFPLRYALASLVALNLEEYFEENGSQDDYWRGWFGLRPESSNDATGMAQRPPIKFIYDIDTNTILVANASPAQLDTIAELIEIYDQPLADDSIAARRLRIFHLEYSRAEAVATTIKEVFRELLSSKDKEFANEENKKEGTQTRTYVRIYGNQDSRDKKPTKVKASFDGALSIGVDKITNTLVVSAQEEWMENIADMIESLDKEAMPKTTVHVHKILQPTVQAKALQAALSKALGRPWPGGKPEEKSASAEQRPQDDEGERESRENRRNNER